MASQSNVISALMFLVLAVAIARASPVKPSLTAEDVPRTLQESPEESLSRFLNDPVYRAGYERAVYDLYTGRFHELFEAPSADNVYPVPSKKAIDLGLGRFNAGSRAANSLMALDSARFSGGPGRK
ncbi:hypothetical protein BV898_17152 [Hypsibius exemplaris]|uniref:Uncharacterized protein n=1 Tax=Hypsibius exemplaris TaxID=2072580 RepID=A0A9X6NLS6_HYPEX|nr:hypothetical protein BV898_17152 [Hypsibius exemplaris]